MNSNSVRAVEVFGRVAMAVIAAIVMLSLMMPSAHAFAADNATQAAAETAVETEADANAAQSASSDAPTEKAEITLASSLASWGFALACVVGEAVVLRTAEHRNQA